ncbi:MAG: nuclear transport factor 2 family protein [Alphaproteobacteria bacterium]|nr:nuclear transport factor 2 family protein [Alphaproteobacteria bacterium]
MGPNEKALRDAYAGYVRGESFAAIFDEHIHWRSVGTPNRVEIAGEWHGTDDVRQYFQALADNWTLTNFKVEEVVGQADRRFAVRISVDVKSNGTGKALHFEKVDFVTMAAGKITDYAEIYDTAPLIRAQRL